MKKPRCSAFVAASTAFAVSLSFMSAAVSAQEQASAAEQPRDRRVLEEVLVTAQRREQSAQDVAISMTVFDQQQLANANMTNTSDLAALTPSLSTDNRFGTENASFSIRGFTMALRTTASVGVYFAEVVAPRGQTIQTSGDGAGPGMFYDLQNVQVLKGPQGTLFGRNTTGGAVLIEPNRPSHEFEGYVELTAGNFGLRQQQAVVNLPLHDRVRLRLGIDRKERDGHLNNATNIGTRRLGDVGYTSGRMGLEIDVTDRIENYTLVHYTDSETKGQTSQMFVCNERDTLADNPILLFTVPGCQQQLENQRATGQDGFYDVVSTVPTPITAIKDLRVINKTSWDITENITLRNIFAYSHLETLHGSDVQGTQFPETQSDLIGIPLPGGVSDPNREYWPGGTLVAPDVPTTSQEAFVEEIQLQGLSFAGRLEWQTGLYYETSRPDGFSGNNSAILVSCELATLESPNPDDFNCFDPLGGTIGGVSEPRVKTTYINRAVYGQASYDFFEWLRLTGGARYTRDKTRGETVFALHNFVGTQRQPAVVSEESASQRSSAPTGLVELQFRPYRDVMTYAKYVRGYRQGSVNMMADPGIQTHDQERVETYEIGAKTSFDWIISGRFDISAFYNDLTDMQLQTGYISPAKGPTTATFNAGSARIRGLEAEAFFQLTDDLSLSFSFSRLLTELREQEDNQAKVEEAAGPVAGATFSPTADVGDTLPFAQERAYTASLNYRLPLPEAIGPINVGATYSYTGSQRTSASSSTPFDVLDPYRVLNLNLSWHDIMGYPLDLSMFATNVRDDEHVTFVAGTFNALGFEVRQMGLPRMYGARLRYNF